MQIQLFFAVLGFAIGIAAIFCIVILSQTISIISKRIDIVNKRIDLLENKI